MNIFLFIIFGFILPFLLWPIEYFLPYPHIVEELAKYGSLLWIKYAEFAGKTIFSKKTVLATIVFALFFSLTETVLYLLNYFALGDFSLIFNRLAIVTPMHILTTLVIFSSLDKGKGYQFFAVILAVIVHYVFNN